MPWTMFCGRHGVLVLNGAVGTPCPTHEAKVGRGVPTAPSIALSLALLCFMVAANSATSAEETGMKANSPAAQNSPSEKSPTVIHRKPKHFHEFSTWKKLNPIWWFGNADDP